MRKYLWLILACISLLIGIYFAFGHHYKNEFIYYQSDRGMQTANVCMPGVPCSHGRYEEIDKLSRYRIPGILISGSAFVLCTFMYGKQLSRETMKNPRRQS